MNIGISHINLIDSAAISAYSTQHLSFPASNVQHRWFVKPWRSRYGEGSGWGRFVVTAANRVISFNEGGGTLTANITTGVYDADSLCAEIKTRMDAAGALTYTVAHQEITPDGITFTEHFVISASGAFVLVLSVTVNSAFPMLGWVAVVDTASLASHIAPGNRIHTSEEVRYDIGAASNIYFAAVKNHNLQSTATPQIIFWSDEFITEAEIENMTWNEDFMVVPLNQFYQYVGFRVADIDNPDLYIEIGRLWIGEWFKPRIGFSMERERVPNDPSVIAESENGQASSIQRTKFDTWNYTFEGVDPTDKDTFDAIFAEVGTSKPIMICEDPDAADLTVNTKYVTITSWEWKHIAGEWWRLELEVKEER